MQDEPNLDNLCETSFLAGVERINVDCSQQTHAECMAEAELVIYDCVENLLHKTGVQPSQASGPMLQQWLQGTCSGLLWQKTLAQGL